MRFRFVARQLGLLMLLLSASMLPSAAWSVYDYHFNPDPNGGREAQIALLLSAAIGAAVSMIFLRMGKTAGKQLGRKEALVLVALSWVVGAALAALPFWLWAARHDFAEYGGDQAFTSFVDCYFEAMSGLTTTGASVLTDIESIPRSLLFWRAFTHWIGGLGIVVLFVAVLPILGVGGKRLFRFEAPGPKKEGVRPRIRAAAQVLWFIYTGITLVEVIALRWTGMTWCDAFSHAFATLATGGFSTQNASITGFGNWKVECIIIVFMFLAGVNFGLYDRLFTGHWRDVLWNPELRAYALIMLAATVLMVVLVYPQGIVNIAGNPEPGILPTLRHTLFTVVSIQTTTGFGTADFEHWTYPAKSILVTLMFVGGCAGSTGGGIKVIRFVVLAKVLWAELEIVFHPNVVRTVRVGRSTVDPQMRSATLVYFLLIGIIVVASTGLILWMEAVRLEGMGAKPAVTAFTAVAATLNNIGPGLHLIGPSQNYAFFTQPTKLFLCLLMALGRLELYAFLVLILPAFWREE